jgi:hypothetical protein
LKRANGASAIIGFIAATLVSFCVGFGKQIFGIEQNISFTWIIPASFLAGFTVVFVLSGLQGTEEHSR